MPRINEIETHDLIPIENIYEADTHSYLRMFMGKVREVYPKCQFSFGNSPNDNGAMSVHVYHDWKPISMGRIGYGNYRDTGGEDTFMVASNRISNGKYSSGSPQYNMKMTKNMDVAVRNAKSFLRDLSNVELASSNSVLCRRSWGDTESTSRGNIREKFERSVRNSDVLIRELQHLVTTGHEFLDMVSVEQRPSGTCFELAHTEDISEFGAVWHPLGTFSEDTMQAEYSDVAGKLAVLQMCEVGQWVDGVGYKSTPTVHYVTT